MNDHFDLIRYPYITEKFSGDIAKNKYQFVVPCSANKIEIKKSLEKIYNVKVLKVNSSSIPSKTKRLRYHKGKTARRKKVLVTLREGYKIDLF